MYIYVYRLNQSDLRIHYLKLKAYWISLLVWCQSTNRIDLNCKLIFLRSNSSSTSSSNQTNNSSALSPLRTNLPKPSYISDLNSPLIQVRIKKIQPVPRNLQTHIQSNHALVIPIQFKHLILRLLSQSDTVQCSFILYITSFSEKARNENWRSKRKWICAQWITPYTFIEHVLSVACSKSDLTITHHIYR